ncbi:MAG TPA: pirin family protein [Alphaproteobacteria bacterium]|nr:pirin family protein [Alphaproteobacteria bacterium]
MSNLTAPPEATACAAAPETQPTVAAYPARPADLGGGLAVHRALPRRERRLVGPWCFLDHFGPLVFAAGKPMDVAPHPHIGLQTVTWLVEGEVLHKDSLGNAQLIRPGQLNLMTAGGGIAHSEETPPAHTGRLHGVQLWTALPEAQRQGAASFAHHPELPTVSLGCGRAVVLMGALAGARSPAKAYSPIIGAELRGERDGRLEVPLDPAFEHALLPIAGRATLDGRACDIDTLYDLGGGRDRLSLEVAAGARLMLIGGAPFGETILMWWNFVARTPEEIARAREDWEQQRRFGEVAAYAGARLPAPPFAGRLKPAS